MFSTKEERARRVVGEKGSIGEKLMRGYRMVQLERSEEQNHKRASQTESFSHEGHHDLKDRSEDAR